MSNLKEVDEQTDANLKLIVNVYDGVEDLIDSGNFSVTPNVSVYTVARCNKFICLSMCSLLKTQCLC